MKLPYTLSFIIPTKNEAKYLPKKLLSIAYIKDICGVPTEVIVADYQSTDNTPEIAKRYGANLIEIDKPGVGYATYIAVTSAKGDIIIRSDADTIITPSAIYSTLKGLTEARKIATVGHIYYPFNLATNYLAYLFDKYLRKPYNTTGYFIAFKKEITNKINFNPRLKANDDWDFGLRAYKIFGIKAFYYDYFNAVIVSSRLIQKKGLTRYLLENLGIIKTTPIPYTHLTTPTNPAP